MNLNNYQSVSNIPFWGKEREHVLASQLQSFLDGTDCLNPFQSGFRPSFGMEVALDPTRDLDGEGLSLLILLHRSMPSETINCGILLQHLSDLGTVLCWCHTFLLDRSQKAVLEDRFFSLHPVIFGVLQRLISLSWPSISTWNFWVMRRRWKLNLGLEVVMG